MVAESPVMREKVALAEKIARTDSPVFITGETGVGKALFAAFIHGASKCAEGPLVRIDCAGLNGSDGESLLFGGDGIKGGLERAEGGSIYLDEVCDMSLPLQGRLLTVLKAMESGESAGTVGVRVIAASSRNVEKMAKSGVFREDLYFRLNVLPLYLPPLRTRPEDIAALAALFLKRSDKGRGTVFSAEAQQAMLGYVWPGNARELENRVEMALVTCEGRVGGAIDAKDLFPTDDAEAAERAAEESADLVLPYPAPLPGTELKEAMDNFKKEFITRRLTAHKWNVTRTAGELGMQRTYLSRLLKELGIKKPDSGTEL